ncbi:Homocysteine [Venturia inaequalis]|nr:Homocysteine [Venturia inaequalis]
MSPKPKPLPLLTLLTALLYTPLTKATPTSPSPQATLLHDNNSQNCTCYTLDSDTNPAYFLYHKFYDFRALPATQPEPPLVAANQRFGTEMALDQAVFNGSAWNRDWEIQAWGKKSGSDAPVAMQNSAQNVYIATDNSTNLSHLTLRTTRLPTFQSTSEIENQEKNLLHASLRIRARIISNTTSTSNSTTTKTTAPGAVAGLFTFQDDTNESDIEILTTDPPTTWHFTNQPATKKGNDIPAASKKIENLPPWNDWRVQRIDWLPKISRWFIDQKFVAGNTYSVPRKPSGLVLNMWSDGGVWSGNMSVGSSAELQIEWIQILFNTSGKRDGPGGKKKGGKVKRWVHDLVDEGAKVFEKRDEPKSCTVICKVDGVEKEGFPEVAYLGAPGAAANLGVAMKTWALVLLAGSVAFVGLI